jgi:hypothetical protein
MYEAVMVQAGADILYSDKPIAAMKFRADHASRISASHA